MDGLDEGWDTENAPQTDCQRIPFATGKLKARRFEGILLRLAIVEGMAMK